GERRKERGERVGRGKVPGNGQAGSAGKSTAFPDESRLRRDKLREIRISGQQSADNPKRET
ncbi:MAG TPA: hypothetical protein PKL65_13580, partial [Bacteroidales bacterium]|nr:hypothetical protein [Bacteroidales bacterium]